jgi:hypothetical protein
MERAIAAPANAFVNGRVIKRFLRRMSFCVLAGHGRRICGAAIQALAKMRSGNPSDRQTCSMSDLD